MHRSSDNFPFHRRTSLLPIFQSFEVAVLVDQYKILFRSKGTKDGCAIHGIRISKFRTHDTSITVDHWLSSRTSSPMPTVFLPTHTPFPQVPKGESKADRPKIASYPMFNNMNNIVIGHVGSAIFGDNSGVCVRVCAASS